MRITQFQSRLQHAVYLESHNRRHIAEVRKAIIRQGIIRTHLIGVLQHVLEVLLQFFVQLIQLDNDGGVVVLEVERNGFLSGNLKGEGDRKS